MASFRRRVLALAGGLDGGLSGCLLGHQRGRQDEDSAVHERLFLLLVLSFIKMYCYCVDAEEGETLVGIGIALRRGARDVPQHV